MTDSMGKKEFLSAKKEKDKRLNLKKKIDKKKHMRKKVIPGIKKAHF